MAWSGLWSVGGLRPPAQETRPGKQSLRQVCVGVWASWLQTHRSTAQEPWRAWLERCPWSQLRGTWPAQILFMTILSFWAEAGKWCLQGRARWPWMGCDDKKWWQAWLGCYWGGRVLGRKWRLTQQKKRELLALWLAHICKVWDVKLGLTWWGFELSRNPAACAEGVVVPRDGPHTCWKALVKDAHMSAFSVPGFKLKIKPTSYDM